MTEIDLTRPWHEYTFVAFDTETSGAYPLGADIVEFGAIKWKAGKIIGEYQTLLKPNVEMTPFNISIHGITNEMVASAPKMPEKISEISTFLKDSVIMAHHAPFDMGFLTADYERNKMSLPTQPVVCTSLLSRNVIKESPNHKLQTLIQFLKLDKGSAHRAFDDAKACLEVGLECFKRMGPDATLEQIQKKMGKPLIWSNYRLFSNREQIYQEIIQAIEHHKDVDIVYSGGSLPGKSRRISPIGIVRNPDGDYVMAVCHLDRAQKRFYISKMKDLAIVY
jgi:DNA polymerase-3 subunit epsilon